MNEIYLCELYKQYLSAIGMKGKVINFNDTGFLEWLHVQEENLNNYLFFLKYKGIEFGNDDLSKALSDDYEGYSIVELDKGKFDSLSAYGAVVVSPYASTLELTSSTLEILDNVVTTKIDNFYRRLYNISLYISHNAFSDDTINKLKNLYNLGYNSLYGIYGSLNDKDKNKKLNDMVKLQDDFLLDGEIEYEEANDSYVAFIRNTESCSKKVRLR